MSKLKLTGKQIRTIGYEEGPVVSVAMHTMYTHFKQHTEEEASPSCPHDLRRKTLLICLV